MAIFSKKNSGKQSDEQAKVILSESLEEKSVEGSAAKETKEAAAADAASAEAATHSLAAAESGAGAESAPVAKSGKEAVHEDVELEAMTPPVAPLEHRFGIDDAILLMRSLPTDPNTALVVRVVRVTLGAVNVSVEEIVADANLKEAKIKEEISALEAKILDIEGQLGSLRREIAAHQANLKETVSVRERLHVADQYPGPKPPPTPIAATLSRLSQTKPTTI